MLIPRFPKSATDYPLLILKFLKSATDNPLLIPKMSNGKSVVKKSATINLHPIFVVVDSVAKLC